MGMTIDEAIHDTEVMKEYLEYQDEPRSEGLGVAIEIMRKYQKIREIVTNNELEWGNASVRANAFLEVKKVVEDGKDII